MAEITKAMVFELMSRIGADLYALVMDFSEVKQEAVSIRGHLQFIHNDLRNIFGILGRHDERFDRIERRLELRELAETQAKSTRD